MIYKSVENGERIDGNSEPTVTLTSKYPRVRVEYKIKNHVEAEATANKTGNLKNATYLFRILIQKMYPDDDFWKSNTAKKMRSDNEDIMDACTSKYFNVVIHIYNELIPPAMRLLDKIEINFVNINALRACLEKNNFFFENGDFSIQIQYSFRNSKQNPYPYFFLTNRADLYSIIYIHTHTYK